MTTMIWIILMSLTILTLFMGENGIIRKKYYFNYFSGHFLQSSNDC